MVVPISKLGPEYNPLANHGVAVLPFLYIGFVKRNDDPQRMGRLSVWIPEMGGDPSKESSWVIVSYASPFAGATDYTKIRPDSQTMDGSQKSYGWWGVPPDINNEVVVFFANGDLARGYWIACTYQQNMNWMVPGIATNVTTEPSPPNKTGPVVEYNKANVQSTTSPRRPRFTPLSNGLDTEGLTTDDERGQSSTSARREAPSQVFGYLTPRGNTVHTDDNHSGDYNGQSVNEFIRIRTRSGTQILVHETTGYVYINSKLGNAWLEVSDAGVDVYSLNSVSMRAQQDFNVRADRNIILDAGGNIFMRSGKGITMDVGSDFQVSTGGALVLTATGNGSIHVAQDLQIKSDSNLRFESETETSMKAGGRFTRDAEGGIFDSGGLSPSTSGSDASVPKTTTQLDSGQAVTGGALPSHWKYGGSTVKSIVSRMPTHEPWGGHPNSKVPPPPTEHVMPGSNGSGAGGNASNIGPDGKLMNDGGCSFGVASTKPISNENFNAIQAASDKVGVPLSTMLAFGDLESSFQAGVGNSSSSAKGMYQFTDTTWSGMVNQYGNKYNVSTDPSAIYDPNANAVMGAQFIKDNTTRLQNLGISDPTPGQLYVMHFMGTGGGPALIKAAQSNPDADASSIFPDAARANPSIFGGKTVGQVYNQLTGMGDTKANAYANQQGLPAPCERMAQGSTKGTSGSTELSQQQLIDKYGDPRSAGWAKENLATVTSSSGAKFTVNKQDAPAFQGLVNDLEGQGYKVTSVGGYNLRNITGGSTLSYHAFGAAIDVNPTDNPYSNTPGGGTLTTNLPSNVSDIAAKWGMQWGGNWSTLKDPMHFQKI